MPPLTAVPASFALSGRVVCMDDARTVLAQGVVYVKDGAIATVQDAAKPAPAGLEQVKPVATGGTIFPGLIELHNHISYNALQLWNVPKKFNNRDEWSQKEPQYQQLVAKPMRVLGGRSELLPAIARYVEAKSLIAGVTTTQGLRLISSAKIVGYYKGCIRNVEEPHDPTLPAAGSHIPDVTHGKDWTKFFNALKAHACVLLHLSEGDPASARQHFLDLQGPDDQWAITPALAAIHCVGLEAQDFHTLKQHGASLVWSPLSNLLLYGETAKVAAAKQQDITVALGSDWSPSGSKNLLGELKVARLWSAHHGDLLDDRTLVEMATRNAARVLTWDQKVGSLEPGKYADLMVVRGASGDPYGRLIDANETDVRLVLVGGVPRFGVPSLMKQLAPSGESVKIGGSTRTLYFGQDLVDPRVASTSLAEATAALTAALHDLPNLANAPPKTHALLRTMGQDPEWRLALDELADEPPPRLERGVTAAPLPLIPLQLDALATVNDAHFHKTMKVQKNLPPYLATGLLAYYA